jgi:poly(hydroxyalkanoate) depolymerase family esterase
MKPLLGKLLGEANRLTRGGKLVEATAAIQRALAGAHARVQSRAGGAAVLDGLVRELPRGAPAETKRRGFAPVPGIVDGVRLDDRRGDVGSFTEAVYANDAGSRAYKLYVPAGFPERPMPLIVMLHGCTQSPDDFAAGTRMNELAQERGFLVLYPAQAPRSNSSKCWNWFVPADQHRGAGEPELLAGMTRHIGATHPVDSERVYVAGLSAGGAMAAILGREYPDLYAAVGVHSGLPHGAAHDVASAFTVMHGGSASGPAGLSSMGLFGSVPAFGATPPPATPDEAPAGAPVIVFHGDRDGTVHPSNGERVVEAAVGGATAARAGIASSLENATAGGRQVTRTVHRRPGAQAGARSLAEHWVVHGGGHAWSGGSPAGSFTDAAGPDASREMIRFFEAHPLSAG